MEDLIIQASSPPKDKWTGIITGHLYSMRKHRLNFMMDGLNNYGDFLKLKFGPINVFLVVNEAAVEWVLSKNAKNYSKNTKGFKAVAEVTGKGVFTESGDSWLSIRKIVQPFFTEKKMDHFESITINTCEELLRSWKSDRENKGFFNISHEMTHATLSILGKAIFNKDLGVHVDTIDKELTKLVNITNEKITRPPFPTLTTLKNDKQFKHALLTLDKLLRNLIIEAKQEKADPQNNLIHAFLAAFPDCTEQYMLDQVKTMTFAGHETSSNVLSWTLSLIGSNKEWKEKITKEVRLIRKDGVPNREELKKMPTLTRAIKEGMRMFPPAWSLGRLAIEDDNIYGNHIPKDSIIIVSPYLIHHHKDYFPNPDKFNPDRFLKEEEDKRNKYHYIPFGAGPRACIAESLAYLEIEMIIATILINFEFDLDPNKSTKMLQELTLRPSGGLWAEVREKI